MSAQFVSTSLCLAIFLKVSDSLSGSLSPHPLLLDFFLNELQQIIVVCNYHMQKVFIPYRISWLDEYMSIWMNELTCPGFFFFPLNPHPKSNKFHTICCNESGIMYIWEIVEGSYHPIPMRRPEFETSPNMKMFGLMLWLNRLLWSTGNKVIMDRILFVLKGFLEMRKRGVYVSELI